jgi:hypothetical protein
VIQGTNKAVLTRRVPETTATVAAHIVADGEASWRLWLFELVDEVRRSGQVSLLQMPPTPDLPRRACSLLASTVEALCAERGWTPPAWCATVGPLPSPWFPSETENLKAMALVESPVWFRRRNVFVLGNFLLRA